MAGGYPTVRVVLDCVTLDIPVNPRAADFADGDVKGLLAACVLEIGRLQHRLAILEGKPVSPLPDLVRLDGGR